MQSLIGQPGEIEPPAARNTFTTEARPARIFPARRTICRMAGDRGKIVPSLAGGTSMTAWTDGHWLSKDGLRLHYRDHGGDRAQVPVLCIPGLTRNARDFEGVAARLAARRRVICVDLRGRGGSENAPDPMTYVPPVYAQDIQSLFDALALERVAVIGTSLGGLVAMLLAWMGETRMAGALINDVGPVVEPAGIDRIRSYVGKPQSWPTWLHAARDFQEAQGHVYPDWGIEAWLAYAKRICRLNSGGRIVFDYDMRIAEPLKAPVDPNLDLWPAFRALGSKPLSVVRGARSDLLSTATLARMKQEVPGLDSVTVPDVGHAPTLEEPEVQAAIDRWLEKVG
jgi:pimeloyl-ACP methyl ester carboxylesterase